MACLFAGTAIYFSDWSCELDDHPDPSTPQATDNWIGYYEAKGYWDPTSYSRYVAALYWSALTVTTVGYGDIVAQNDTERLVNSCTMVLSSLIYAVIFGNIALYVANLNRDETNYQEAVGALIAHMKDISLPPKLQQKVRAYHDYVWSKTRGRVGDTIGIPQRVQTEMAAAVHGRMLKSNMAFTEAPAPFINAAALALRSTVCLPNEYVYRERESAENIYFIARGQVGVFRAIRDGVGSMTVMKHGAHFGEIPMLLVKRKEDDGASGANGASSTVNGQCEWIEDDWLQTQREQKTGYRMLSRFRVCSVEMFLFHFGLYFPS